MTQNRGKRFWRWARLRSGATIALVICLALGNSACKISSSSSSTHPSSDMLLLNFAHSLRNSVSPALELASSPKDLIGRLEIIAGDDFEGRRYELRYFVRDESTGKITPIEGSHPDLKDAKRGDRVQVRMVTSIDSATQAAGASSPRIAGVETLASTPSYGSLPPTGTFSMLSILLDFSDSPLQCSSSSVSQLMHGTSNSVTALYREITEGQLQIQGQVIGPFRLSVPSTASCDYHSWHAEARALSLAAGVNPASFDLVQFVFPTHAPAPGAIRCAAGAVGPGPRDINTHHCSLGDVTAHEIGHTMGLGHAAQISPSNPNQYIEYADISDIMGMSGVGFRQVHGFHREKLGWIDPAKILVVSTEGSFQIAPLELTRGQTQLPQLLKVRRPGSTETYWVSYRQPIGFDAAFFANNPLYARGASIHKVIFGTAGVLDIPILQTVTSGSQPYLDASKGVRIAQISATSSHVTLNVTFPEPVLVVDTIAPTIRIDQPLNGATVRGTFLLSGDSYDYQGVVRSEVFVDGNLYVTINGRFSASSISTANYPNGPHTIQVKAYDAAGNTGSAQISVIVDNDQVVPTISFSSPINGATVSGNTQVVLNASDNVGIAHVYLYINGQYIGADTTAPYSFMWDTRSLPNGSTHRLIAGVVDTSGNENMTPLITVTANQSGGPPADGVPPVTTLAEPAAGSTLGGQVTVSAHASDNVGVSRVDFLIDGAVIGTDFSAPYSTSFDSRTHANGPHALQSKAYDAAGNVGSSAIVSVTFFNDSQPPTITHLAPAEGALLSGSVTVSAAASDNVGVSQVQFFRNNALVATDSTFPYEYSWDTRQVPNNPYQLKAVAFDAAGNSAATPGVWMNVYNPPPGDTTAPLTSLTSPASGSILGGQITISASASDNVGVSRVDFLLDGSVIGSDTSAPYSASLDTLSRSNGLHSLQTKAYDAAGNFGSSAVITVEFFNDTQPPVISHATPASGTPLQGTVSVSVNASDNVAVTQVQFFRNGAVVATVTSAPYSYSWNTQLSENGAHVLKAVAWDAAGNSAATPELSVTVSNPPPVTLISISGVIFASESGKPLSGTRLKLYDSTTGQLLQTIDSGLGGTYSFSGVTSGRTYLITAAHKQYRFQFRTITPTQDTANIDFFGNQ